MTTSQPTFWQKITTQPKCHQYINLIMELNKINKNEIKTEIDHQMKFTKIEYDLEINRSSYPDILSMGKNHDLRCTKDGKKCLLAEYANSPLSSTLAYCLNKYADKFSE